MKCHTTNYFNTFIIVADDCPATKGEIPPGTGLKDTVAGIQYDLISKNPYRFTSDEVLLRVYMKRNSIGDENHAGAKELFFSKGQACFRSSPLTKRYGWGIHFNDEGKMALYGSETEPYGKLAGDPNLTALKALRLKSSDLDIVPRSVM